MKFTRVIDGVAVEVFVEPVGFELAECFTHEIVAQFEPCGDEVQAGWVRNEAGELAAPVEPVV